MLKIIIRRILLQLTMANRLCVGDNKNKNNNNIDQVNELTVSVSVCASEPSEQAKASDSL